MITYGDPITVHVNVIATSGSGIPKGDVGLLSDSTVVDWKSINKGTLANGTATIITNQWAIPGGTYNLYAHYVGDDTFAPSISNVLPVKVNLAAASVSVTTSSSTVSAGQTVSFFVTTQGVSLGSSPTGTLTFTDSTSGKTLGTATLAPSDSADPKATAYFNVDSSSLQVGKNIVTINYSGDGNYLSATANSLTVNYLGTFTATIAPGVLNISAGSGSGSALVTVTPSSGTLDAAGLTFSCPSLPAGVSCAFSVPAVRTNGSVNSNLTINVTSSLLASAIQQPPAGWMQRWRIGMNGAGIVVALCFVNLRRKRSLLAVLMAVAIVTSLSACGGGSSKSSAITATTTTITSSTASSLHNSPVTLTAAVTAVKGSAPPSGTVAFFDGTTLIGTSALSGGGAALTISSLPLGSHILTAQYEGAMLYSTSTSSATVVNITYTAQVPVRVTDRLGNNSTANVTLTVQ
jgi:hypothetical protein